MNLSGIFGGPVAQALLGLGSGGCGNTRSEGYVEEVCPETESSAQLRGYLCNAAHLTSETSVRDFFPLI